MGLDMYLRRARKIGGATAEEVENIEGYISYMERSAEDRKFSLKDWCGVNEADVRMDLVEDYKSDYVPHYGSWDTEHLYPFYSITESVGYWRKANAIHNWFVENVQGGIDECQPSEVSKEQLEELLDIVNICIDSPTRADTLLPTQSGFFFGSTDYDEYYFADLETTRDIISNILDTTDFDNYMIIYQASW